MLAGLAKGEPIYQAPLYQAANQPDNLQLLLLPGWATLYSTPTAFKMCLFFTVKITKSLNKSKNF